MEQEISKQHVQLPNNMGETNLTPKDQLIYLSIRRFMNSKSKIAYPSLAKISEVSGACISTVRSSIARLEEKDYFKVVKKGKAQEYHFNELKAFEPFSYDFLDNSDLTFTEKSYIAATQQYMYKDVEGIGKVSYTNKELAEKINMTESTISRTNNSLIRKNYLTIVKNEARDIESGCKTDTKIFNLNKLGQAIIWVLQNHEERREQNTEDILKLKIDNQDMKRQLEEQKKLIDKLLKEREKEHTKYTI